MANYITDKKTKTIYADSVNLTIEEKEAIALMLSAGWDIKPKRKMSELTKSKMVSPKEMYIYMTENKSTYTKVLEAWEKAKKELVECVDKKTNAKKTRKGGDMHARSVIKKAFPDDYKSIIEAIRTEKAK